jgi:hypothetical protein
MQVAFTIVQSLLHGIPHQDLLLYSGLAMVTADPQGHIGVGVFCLLGAVFLYRAWFRGPAIIGN